MSAIATRLGKVRGIETGGARVFLGLRYGEPPLGNRRFRAAQMVTAWRGVFDATRYPNRAMQGRIEGTLGQKVAGELSEDCLFLNVATPSVTGAHRPVLVWIHGGGLVAGSANEYDGSVLAAQGDVVVVTINFRLGLFGFLDLSRFGPAYAGSASNGFRDQILALAWVRDNVEDYGGDPDNVTIFGESSGASSVLSLLASPSADGLYHKAIAHSATSAYRPPDDRTEELAKLLAVASGDCLDKLLAMSAREIADLNLPVRISVDGTVVTRSTQEAINDRGASGVPLVAGTNRREGTLYTGGSDGARDHYARLNRMLATDMLCGRDPGRYLAALDEAYPEALPGKIHEMIWTDMFRKTCIDAAESATRAGPRGWLYRFDLPANRPDTSHLGATHACEMAFTFNTFANPDTHAYSFHDRKDPVVRRVAMDWSSTILAMARSGEPNGGGMPEWPVYEPGNRNCLIIDERSRIASDQDARHRVLWERSYAPG